MEQLCDRSCPKFVETSYLLDRNNISINHPMISNPVISTEDIVDFLDTYKEKFVTYIVPEKYNTIDISVLFTYVAICMNWKGNQLHCNVYNLKYSQYVEAIKQTWTTHIESDELQYTKIWSESAKVLIISSIDYVNFGDFESQTLLSLIQLRQSKRLTTVLISPDTRLIVGAEKSRFFPSLINLIKASNGERGDKR